MRQLFTAMLLFLSASCTTYDRIESTVKPVERADIELNGECAIIRTLYFDASAEMATPKKLDRMNLTSLYSQTRAAKTGKIFAVIIHNTSDDLLKDIHCSITSGGKMMTPLSSIEMKPSPYAPRRLVISEFAIEKIDFDLSSNMYFFDFIIPNDRILYLFTFEDFIMDKNAFRLSVELSARGSKKTVDFDFKVIEHRL